MRARERFERASKKASTRFANEAWKGRRLGMGFVLQFKRACIISINLCQMLSLGTLSGIGFGKGSR